jgi:hypothetical protein
MNTQRIMAREIGTALAVLAIYLLTILSPLHQARAGQLAFEQLGYATLDTGWVLCNPAGAIGHDSDIPVGKCPATGIGKDELALSPPLASLTIHRATDPAPRPVPQQPLGLPQHTAPPSGPRGPPVLV